MEKNILLKSGDCCTIFHYKSSFLNLSYFPASFLQYRSLPFLPPLTFIYSFSCWWTFELILVCFFSMICNDAMNILVFSNAWIYALLCCLYPVVRLFDHRLCTCLLLVDNAKQFSKVMVPIYTLVTEHECFSRFTFANTQYYVFYCYCCCCCC